MQRRVVVLTAKEPKRENEIAEKTVQLKLVRQLLSF